jgi:hypothetical protein
MATTAKAAKTLVCDFAVEKDTPNTIRFKEDEPADGSRPSIGTIYILKKDLLPMGNTKRIRVTVEAIG